MSHTEMLNTWDSENLVGEELTDDELTSVQGGSLVNIGPITTQVQIQVAAANFASHIAQLANQQA